MNYNALNHQPPSDDGPDAAEIERLAREVLVRLPEPFAGYLDRIVLRIEEFADAETLEMMNIASRWGLLGLYSGVPLDKQSIWAAGDMPPTVSLYRRPLLAEMRRRGVSAEAMIAHVTIHEIGHHFGLSDADMHALEQAAD